MVTTSISYKMSLRCFSVNITLHNKIANPSSLHKIEYYYKIQKKGERKDESEGNKARDKRVEPSESSEKSEKEEESDKEKKRKNKRVTKKKRVSTFGNQYY